MNASDRQLRINRCISSGVIMGVDLPFKIVVLSRK
jgi:hypothetical protein